MIDILIPLIMGILLLVKPDIFMRKDMDEGKKDERKKLFQQHRKVYNVSPKSPPDLLRTSQRAVVWPPMAKAKSKRLGLRKSPKIGNRKLSPKAIFLKAGIGAGIFARWERSKRR